MEKTLSELNNYIDTGKAENFYTWTQWRRVRDEVLKLDNYECQACKQNGRHRRAEVVHHIKHLKDRPDLALSIWDGQERQLVSLCRECHEKVHPERIKHKWKRKTPLTVERWD